MLRRLHRGVIESPGQIIKLVNNAAAPQRSVALCRHPKSSLPVCWVQPEKPGEMEAIEPSEFDLVVIGTGLTESIVAA